MILNLPDRVREVCALLLFGAATFLLLACTSLVESTAGGSAAATANLCGAAGVRIATAALHTFGYAAYLGIFVMFTWSLALFSKRPLSLGPFRLVWFALCLMIASATISHFCGETLRLPDSGGLVGYEIARFFESTLSFGSWGTGLTLLVLTLITIQLATDFVLYTAVMSAIGFFRERGDQAAAVLKKAGPLFASLLGEDRPEAKAALEAEQAELAAAPPAKKSRRERKAEAAAAKAAAKAAKAAGDDVGVTDAEVEGFPNEPAPADGADARRGRKDKKDKAGSAEPPAPAAENSPDEMPEPAQKRKRGRAADPAPTPAAASNVPPMLEDDPDAGVAPHEQGDEEDDDGLPEPVKKKSQAKIRYEPPKGAPAGTAVGFDKENVHYAPPPAQKRVPYEFPSTQLLERSVPVPAGEFQKMIEHNVEVLESALASYKVEAEVEEIQKGPVITMFELNVAAGTRVDRIRALEDDLAIRMKAPSVRIVAPIPGKSTIGIEVPNSIRETVRLRELVESSDYKSEKFAIPVFLGKDAAGRPLIEDLAKMPHALIAGATGAGKSVCLNSIIMSVLFTRSPEQVRMILIDPKMVELSSFENIPHLMCPVVRDMNKAAQILEWACAKMDERYEILAEVGARNIFAYNKLPEATIRERMRVTEEDTAFETRMPFIVIVVDELADLMMVGTKEVEHHITRLAQKSRAVGIHVILATQRPSTNVITGLIKANMPTRISFQVASKIDSRVVLDQNGAEKLLGFGDMLYMPPRSSALIRSQGTFVEDDEITTVVAAVRTNAPLYAPELMQKKAAAAEDPREVDDLYEEAVRFVLETRRGSASLLQRRFSIGYTRASRLIDLMANDGVLGEYKNAQAREVVLTEEEYDARLAERESQRQSA